MIRKYKDLLKKEYKLTSNRYRIEIQFKPEDINLEDPMGLVKHLSLIEAKLRFKPV